MNSQAVFVILALLVAAIIAAVMTVYSWRRKSVPGLRAFALMTAGLAWWSLWYGAEIALPGLAVKLWMARAEYIGIVSVPCGWALFAVGYTGRDRWLTRKWIIALAVVPVVTILAAFTNDFHHLFYTSITLNENGPLSVLDASYGALWFLNFSYSYLMMLAGTIYLLVGVFSIPRGYWFQQTLLILSPLLPWIANALYILRLSPIPQLDLSPLAFTVSAAILATDIFRFGLFNVTPVARSAVVDHLNIAVLVVDNRNQVVDINPAACKLVGCRPSDALGQPVEKVLHRWQKYVEHFSNVVEANEEIVIPGEQMQYHYRLQINPIYNSARRVTGRLILLTDITKDKLAEQAMSMAEVRAEFLAKVSRELQTPLNGVLATTGQLQNGLFGMLTYQQERALRQIVERVQHLSQLMNDLLQHTQLVAGQFSLDMKEFAPDQLLNRVHEMFDLAARRKGLWLKTELSPGVPLRLLGDPMRLYQILSNLTDNAIKFTESGEVKVRLFAPDAKHWGIEVSDTGVGIPEERQKYIFDAFQLTDFNVTQSYRGIGLGLAIVKQLVDAMGGALRLLPDRKPGATFLVTLPLQGVKETTRKDVETRFMF